MFVDALQIWCPFEYRQNYRTPVSEVEDGLVEWALAAGMLTDDAGVRRFRAARFGELASYVYPEVPDLLVYAKWLSWLFLVDDTFDENQAQDAGGIEHGARPYLPPAGVAPARATAPATQALVDLWRELAGTMPTPLQDRFRRSVDDYVRSYATEMALARGGQAPDLGAYVRLRRDSGAVETCTDLIERQRTACLRPAVAALPQVAELRKAANDVICWSNDVMSLPKEIAHGEQNNIVAVLREATGMGWQAAATVAGEMIAARTREFVAIERALLAADPSTATKAFTTGLKWWISGSLQWHAASPRYARPDADLSRFSTVREMSDRFAGSAA
jgi:hypothetical protein